LSAPKRIETFPPRTVVVARLEALIEELNRSSSREEKRRGWSKQTRGSVIDALNGVLARLADPRPIHPRETDDPLGVFRGLDAMGIALKDPLARRIVDAASAVRKLATQEKRAAKDS
jgi:hypothetical protein